MANKLMQLFDLIIERNPQTVAEVKEYIIELTQTERKSKVFQNPKLREVIYFFVVNGYTEEAAVKAFDYYETGEWHDSRGNPVKNWKLKMKTVWFKEENKLTKPSKPKQEDYFHHADYLEACKKFGYEP